MLRSYDSNGTRLKPGLQLPEVGKALFKQGVPKNERVLACNVRYCAKALKLRQFHFNSARLHIFFGCGTCFVGLEISFAVEPVQYRSDASIGYF